MSAAAEPAGAPSLATLVPLPLVALPMSVGLLAELVGWSVVSASPLHAGWYGRPALLLGVHLVAIGGLLLPVLGAGWQLTPVVTTKPLSALSAARRIGPVALVGALLLWVGMGGLLSVGALGAALVIGGLLARSFVVVPSLLAARGRIGIRGWLLAGEASLWAGLALAAALYAGKLGHPVLGDPISAIGRHFSLLAVGWIGGWEIGLGALLLPMFALGREPRPGLLLVAGALWFGGIAAASPWVWGVGAVFAVGLLLGSLVGPRGFRGAGPGLLQAGTALVGLSAVAALALLNFPPHVVVAAAFVLWLLPFQHGVALRVAPFLAWAHVLAGRSNRAPISLVDPRLASAQAVATGLGGALLVVGLVAGLEPLARLGALFLALGAALHLATVAGVGLRVFSAWRAAVALPGTASEAP